VADGTGDPPGIVRAVKHRRPHPIVLAAMLVLAGCVEGAPDTAAGEPAVEEAPATEDAADPGDEPDRGPAATQRDPALPPLHPVIDDWDETVVTIPTDDGATPEVDAKVAATPDERQRGLMEVEALPDGTGMLFLFDQERTGGFWMRNTLVPLDIAYIDADGVIGTILTMDPCEEADAADCPTYVPDGPYLSALEVPQGWFAQVGVAEGDEVAWATPGPASGP
jgi:uncharacterized protein